MSKETAHLEVQLEEVIEGMRALVVKITEHNLKPWYKRIAKIKF